MNELSAPPPGPPDPPASELLAYEEVLAALDGLTPLDLARLDAIERRYLNGTDFAEGDLLQEAMCAALFEEKKCPRSIRFIAFLVQSMRNIAGHRRDRLLLQVPIEDATVGERKSKFEPKDSGQRGSRGCGGQGGAGSAGVRSLGEVESSVQFR